jgi:uncharacterized protein YciI
MIASVHDRIQELTQRMLRRKFYVVLSTPKAAPEALTPHLPDHLEYMIGLERDGVLFASGPLTSPGDGPRGEGLTILRVGSAEEAARIAQRDPFYVNGLRDFDIKEWTVMEGSLRLRVNYSDQSIALE